jgi:hypothetical protein
VSYSLGNSIDAKEECGTRYVTLVEGVYQVAGKIERFYTGSGTWAIFGVAKGEAALDYCDIKIHPNGTASGQPYIQISGIKFDKIAPSHRPGANLMLEEWDFMGSGSITTGSN